MTAAGFCVPYARLGGLQTGNSGEALQSAVGYASLFIFFTYIGAVQAVIRYLNRRSRWGLITRSTRGGAGRPMMNKGVIVRIWILALLWLPLLAVAQPPDGTPAPAGQAAALDADQQGAAGDSDDWGAPTTAFDEASSADEKSFDERDPWEGFNRKMFAFNDTLDRYALKPAAKGYRWLTPQWLNDTVSRFFQNLHDLTSGFNYALQWRWGNAFDSFGRFSFNSTVGVAGLFDVASKLNIPKHSTNLDMTLSRWGLHSGPYVMLPILGPSTVRGTAAVYPSAYMWPVTYIDDDLARYGTAALYGIDMRADLLDLEKNIIGDRYTFIRNAYLQRHLSKDAAEPALPEDDQELKDNDGW